MLGLVAYRCAFRQTLNSHRGRLSDAKADWVDPCGGAIVEAKRRGRISFRFDSLRLTYQKKRVPLVKDTVYAMSARFEMARCDAV